MKRVNKFLDWLAVHITNAVGSMYCALMFCCLAGISLPDAIHGGVYTTIQWISQTFLQLVLLSIIMVGSKVLAKSSERRAEQDHKILREEFKEIKEILAEVHQLHKELHEVLKKE